MPGPIKRFDGEDIRNVDSMGDVIANANVNSNFTANEDMEVYATPGGRSILRRRIPRITDRRLAQIIAGESSDYQYPATSCRYRAIVLSQKLAADRGVSPPTSVDDVQLETDPDADFYPDGGDNGLIGADLAIGAHVTAINYGECATADLRSDVGTHYLKEDGTLVVEIFLDYDREGLELPHWFFVLPVPIPPGELAGLPLITKADGSGAWGVLPLNDTNRTYPQP